HRSLVLQASRLPQPATQHLLDCFALQSTRPVPAQAGLLRRRTLGSGLLISFDDPLHVNAKRIGKDAVGVNQAAYCPTSPMKSARPVSHTSRRSTAPFFNSLYFN